MNFLHDEIASPKAITVMKPTNFFKKPRLIYLFFVSSICCFSNTFGQLQAKFSASITSGCAPSVINFIDESTGAPTEWKWDLGNGTISSLQNPSASYFNPGVYTIKLTVKNSSGTDSLIKQQFITIHGSPIVSFNQSAVRGCFPASIQFTDQTPNTNGAPSIWEWDFGDGQLANTKNTQHIYTDSGLFSVTLKVTNIHGCVGTLQKRRLIEMNGVKANYSNTLQNRCFLGNIYFINSSLGNGNLQYTWTFGDGNQSNTTNPVNPYQTGGNYNVKLLVTNQHGCKDSLIKTIAVDTPMTAKFTSSATNSCRTPFNVQFNASEKMGNVYNWSFGDGTSSNLANPNHTYLDSGSYTVRLTVYNTKSGLVNCIDSVKKVDYIKIQKTQIFTNLPDSGCAPLVKRFAVDTFSSGTITNYKWMFGDGTFSLSPRPVHTYSTIGNYDVTVITTTATGCTDTTLITNAIKLGTKPTANFNTNTFNACASTPISFNNLSTGANQWLWMFGDNSSDESQHPTHKFKDTGFLNITLIAINAGCNDTFKIPRYVYIKPAIAKFSFVTNCANNLTVKFVNTSIGGRTFLWNFGDGTTSTENSPTHTYPRTGSYNIRLDAYNDSTGCNSFFIKGIVVVKDTTSFIAVNNNICRGDSVTFVATTNRNNLGIYFWDFGDGTSLISTRKDTIHHQYHKPGRYTVKLIRTSIVNCRDTIIQPLLVKVNGPTAKFTTLSNGICVYKAANFIDSSVSDGAHNIVQWHWDFGDTTTATLTAPPFNHTYNNIGAYQVSLKVTDAIGCVDSFTLSKKIVASTISSTIIVYDSITCPQKSIRLGATFSQAGFSYMWDLGDGTTANTQFVNKAYVNTGMYTIKLAISNGLGCIDSTVKVDAIKVFQPESKFSINDSFKTCPPLIVQFSDSSKHAISKVWDFGDGTTTTLNNPSHFYTYPGEYIAKLTIVGPGGCISVSEKRITVQGPRGTINYTARSLCKPYTVDFIAHSIDAVGFTWDFNDGYTITNNDSTMQHTYVNAGSYIPKILLIDNFGCRVPVSGRDSIVAVKVKAAFEVPQRSNCDSSSINFINTTLTNDRSVTYKWNFGDGSSSSNLVNPVHTYLNAGTYYPSLIAKTITGCSDTLISTTPIKLAASPKIAMSVSTNGCVPLVATVQASFVSGSPVNAQWNWDFGNGTTSNVPSPPSTVYNVAGRFNILLTVTDSNNCKASAVKTIEAYGLPAIYAGPDSFVCKGRAINLKATGANQVLWLANASLSCTNCATPTANPTTDTWYIVKGTSNNNCVAFDSVFIKVKDATKLVYRNLETICEGQSVKLFASGATNYSWTPTRGLKKSTSATPEASPDTTTTYRVVGIDNIAVGCTNDTGYVVVKVNNAPAVNAGMDKTTLSGAPIDLEARYSEDVLTVNWSPTDALSRNGYNTITVRPKVNTDYTVEVTNRVGCSAKDVVKVYVACNGNNVFIPNTFSPNNDGSNDVFYPRGTGLMQIKSLKIYNRWGNIVFDKSSFNANDPSAGWDGTYKGTKLLADVFIYTMEVVCEGGFVNKYNGNISLLY